MLVFATLTFPVFFLMFVEFIVFLALQVSISKRRKTFIGYIGCGIGFALTLLLPLWAIILGATFATGPPLAVSAEIFLAHCIPPFILLIVTIITNRKHKNIGVPDATPPVYPQAVSKPPVSEMDKININDLD